MKKKKENKIEKRISSYKDFMLGFSRREIKKNKLIDNWNKEKKKSFFEAGLYVHIPFCTKVCSFCDCYTGLYRKDLLDNYLETLHKQINNFNEVFKGFSFSSLYFGGGTPSILSDFQLEKLLSFLFLNFRLEKTHFSFETTPVLLSIEKIKILKKFHINRITVGVQSFDEKVLRKNNREYYDFQTIKRMVDLLKSNDIRVNIELIKGLAFQDIKSYMNDLKLLEELEPDQINIYDLIVNELTLNYGIKSNIYYDLSKSKEIEKREKSIFKKYKKTNIGEMIKNEKSKNHQIYNSRFQNHSLLGLGDGSVSKINKENIYLTSFEKGKISYYKTKKIFNNYSELV